MALSPADFVAYSRATGAPYPESPEERAQLAPEVAEFRRNQLQAPQQESNLLSTLGTAALGLGAAIGAGLATRRLLGARADKAFQIPKAQSQQPKLTRQGMADVALAGTMGKQRAAEEVTRQARAERMPGTVVTNLPQPRTALDPWTGREGILDPFAGASTLPYARTDLPIARTPGTFREFSRDVSGVTAAERLAQDPELLSLVNAQKAEELSEARSFQSKAQAEYRRLISGIADDIIAQERAAVQGPVANQTMNALESGEDQMTGRMKSQLQRNEDLDMSQVELLENMAAQNRLMMRASADPSQMIGYVPDEPINQAASQLPDGLPVDQAEGTRRMSSQDLADVARDEMIALRQEVARQSQRPKTIKTKSGKLRVVPESTERSERQLAKSWITNPTPGAEPGSTAFLQLQEQGQVELALPGVIRKAVDVVEELPEEEGLESKFLRSVPNVGPSAVVTSTAAGTAIRGASPVYETVEPQQRTRQIFGSPDVLVKGAPDEEMPDYPASYSAMHQILAKPDLPERIDPYAEKRLSGGSAGIGVYGPELAYVPGAMSKATGEYSKAASREPSYVPKWLQQREGPTGFGAMTTAQVLAGAQKAPEGRVKSAFESELNRRTRAKESIALSEVLRRGRIKGLF